MTYQLVYTGVRKIIAIKMIRRFTGFGLKESMAAIKNPNGFLVSDRDAEQIIMSYLEYDSRNSPFIHRYNAWTIRPYDTTTVDDLRSPGGL